MSDDFFKNFESGHSNSNVKPVMRPSTGPRKKAPPPPPPRNAAATGGGGGMRPSSLSSANPSAASYYGNANNASSGNAPRAAAPPAAPSARATTTTRTARPVVQSRLGARPTANNTNTPGSYYGNTNHAAPSNYSTAAASNPYATSRVAAPSPSQFYGQAQQQQQQPVMAQQEEDTTDDWFQDDNNSNDNPSTGYQQQQQPGQFQQQQQYPGQFQQQPQQQPGHFRQPGQFGQQPQPGQFQQPGQFGQQQSQELDSGLQGTMDGGAAPKPNVFVPTMKTSQSSSSFREEDFENEPPLLEELGINPQHIFMKVKAVVLPSQRIWGKSSALIDPHLIVDDADLAGPVAFGLALGGELLLTGKIHFGYIYGFGIFGCLAMTLLINLLSPQQAVSIWTVASILGYALLPVNLLAAVKIVVINLAHFSTLGQVLGILTVLWSTAASTRLLEVGCQLRDQRYLLAYPLAMLYSAFVLITIF